MKYFLQSCRLSTAWASHPARGEWIEITVVIAALVSISSHPARGEWIEIDGFPAISYTTESHPARGEWIEIYRAA